MRYPYQESAAKYHNTRANEFDAMMGEIEFETAMQYAKGPAVLDVGCGTGALTARLCKNFRWVHGLDCDTRVLKVAQKENPGPIYETGDAAEKKFEYPFSTILLLNILEHVQDPVAVLKNMKNCLAPEGIVFALVPNANSFNRQIGEAMGLVESKYELSQEEIDLYGHRRVYDMQALQDDMWDAGLTILDSGGTVLKPFTNGQMLDFMKSQSGEWQDKFMEALNTVGQQVPELCGAIYVVAG